MSRPTILHLTGTPWYDFMGLASYLIPLRYKLILQGYKIDFIPVNLRHSSDDAGRGARSAAVVPDAV